MKPQSTQIELSKREERALDDLAKTSPFWSSVRAKYAEFGALTGRQHELFVRDCERSSWQRDAVRIGGVPVRNKFRTEAGKPRCAHRDEWCDAVATVAIGTFGYCSDHADAAREDLAAWTRDRDDERARARAGASTADDSDSEEETE